VTRTRFVLSCVKIFSWPQCLAYGRKKSTQIRTHACNNRIKVFRVFSPRSNNVCIHTCEAISSGIVRFRDTKKDGRTAAVNYILYKYILYIYSTISVIRPCASPTRPVIRHQAPDRRPRPCAGFYRQQRLTCVQSSLTN
jgi:hypothetical protein